MVRSETERGDERRPQSDTERGEVIGGGYEASRGHENAGFVSRD